MTRHITFLLLFTFLFTACVERGQALSPNNLSLICTQKASSTPTLTEKEKSKNINIIEKEKSTQKNIIKNKISVESETISSLKEDTVEEKINNQESFFTFTEETKNKISGFFVVVIGVIIFL